MPRLPWEGPARSPVEYLIPDHWFDPLPTWQLLMYVALAVVALVKGADWLVDGASGIAFHLGIPKVIIGATIVSLGTTSPEAAVSVMAAWSGEPGLALGNAVGSVICDTGLIFGLGCLLAVLPADRFVLQRQGWVQFGAAVMLAAVCYLSLAVVGQQAHISRLVGIGFLMLLLVYMRVSIRWSRQHPHGEPFQFPANVTKTIPGAGETRARSRRAATWWLGGMSLAGLVVVIFACRVLICSVIEMAERWNVPQVVIAATLVALGTSLPELVTAVASIVKKHPELLVGNVIGADILNVLFVVGASAAAAPLPVIESVSRHPAIFLWLHLPFMLGILVLFRVYIALAVRRKRFSRWMGAPLLAAYVAYVVIQYSVSLP